MRKYTARINLKKFKKPYSKIKARELVKEKIRIEEERVKKRTCPVCEEHFTWRQTETGQIYCKRACALLDPNLDKGGRPTVMKDDVLLKLRYAFTCDSTDEEACIHAGISVNALQSYFKIHPEFKEERTQLKKTAILRARVRIFNEIPKKTETAKWYLERKLKNEFATKTIASTEVVTGEMDPEAVKKAMEILHEYGEDDD